MLGLLQQQQKLRFKSGGSSNWENDILSISLTALDKLLECFPVSTFLRKSLPKQWPMVTFMFETQE
jgi:hypothetical protein